MKINKFNIVVAVFVVIVVLLGMFIFNLLGRSSDLINLGVRVNAANKYVSNIADTIDLFDAEQGTFEITLDLPNWGYYGHETDDTLHSLQITSEGMLLFDVDGELESGAKFGVHPQSKGSIKEIICNIDYLAGQLIVKKQNVLVDNDTIMSTITLNVCGSEMVFEDIYTKEEVYIGKGHEHNAEVKMDFS